MARVCDLGPVELIDDPGRPVALAPRTHQWTTLRTVVQLLAGDGSLLRRCCSVRPCWWPTRTRPDSVQTNRP